MALAEGRPFLLLSPYPPVPTLAGPWKKAHGLTFLLPHTAAVVVTHHLETFFSHSFLTSNHFFIPYWSCFSVISSEIDLNSSPLDYLFVPSLFFYKCLLTDRYDK